MVEDFSCKGRTIVTADKKNQVKETHLAFSV